MNHVLNVITNLNSTLLWVEAVSSAAGGILVAAAFFAGRRAYRKFRARHYDELSFQIHQRWREIVKGAVPAGEWRRDPMQCEIVQIIVVQEIGMVPDKDRIPLQEFLRSSGLLDRCIQKVQGGHGTARRRAMLALGAMRLPEAIGPLSEALDDWQLDVRMAAVHGLGSTGLVDAAEPIIESILVGGLKVPPDPVANALVRCFRDHPNALLPYLRRTRGEPHAMLAHVASELATPEMADEMVVLAADPRPEVRASAARAFAAAPLALAIPALTDLARDAVWFVRLRAATALNEICHPRIVPILLEAVRDPNRLVRARVAAALARFERDRISILRDIVDSHDRYALHAMISALELGGGMERVIAELSDPLLHDEMAGRLLDAIREGTAGLWSARPSDPVVESVFP